MEKRDYPFYIKSTSIMLGICLLVLILYVGQDILVPLAFAGILAILLHPVTSFLEKRKFPRIIAISLTVFAALIFVGLIFYFMSAQIAVFSEAFPKLKAKAFEGLSRAESWIEDSYHVSTRQQVAWMKNNLSTLSQHGGAVIGATVTTVSGLLIMLTLIPVYVFLILYYRPLFITFALTVFDKRNTTKVNEVLVKIKAVIQSYLVGLLIEGGIVAVLNCTALLVLGIDYAIFLGVLGAMLNVIPYIGGIIAILLPVIIALVTKDGFFYPAMVIAAYVVIQFIDNHFLIPKIVAAKVRINAFISIIAVLVGGALWGVSGMFLVIPMVAIVKIIFDHIESMKPWGMLLGDDLPGEKKTTKISPPPAPENKPAA
ncbi:MAG: AI-2E family transporter [Cytophagaceae bacterium]